jgi:tripartite-type tricarboxylate transporter receptor subunit TctC
MKLPRRTFLQLAAGAAALQAVPRIARAQTYPTRPVRIIVAFAPGGTPDIIARLMAQWLSERLGQQFIIENKPGASGNIGAEAAVNSPPDGHTLLQVSTVYAINATLYDKLNFKLIRDIAPVASIFQNPNVMEVNPSFPVKTVPEFIAYAKAYPEKINFASGGIGTTLHVTGELFKMMTGINMVHVPYRGVPPVTGLLGGEVQVMFDNMPSSIEHIRAGRLRALAVTTSTRSDALPNVPAIGEFVPGYEASTWFGIGAPKRTPVEIIDKLNREINASLTDPKINARYTGFGGAVLPGSPADFARLIAHDIEKWARVVEFSGAKPD